MGQIVYSLEVLVNSSERFTIVKFVFQVEIKKIHKYNMQSANNFIYYNIFSHALEKVS